MAIEGHIRYLLEVTNAFSHTEDLGAENSTLQLSEFREMVRSPYLLYSLTFQLLDVLLWFKAYAEANPDVAKNKSLWVDTQGEGWVTGKVGDPTTRLFLAAGGSAYIPRPLADQEQLQPGMRIEVQIKDSDPRVVKVGRRL